MAIAIRPARPSDHPHFLRLFPELGVDDPLPSAEKFERELMPTTILAEANGAVAGYAYFQRLGDTTYVRHVATAPTHRRQGIGTALLAAIRGMFATGRWCLNVKTDNTAAIALYEGQGLRQTFRSWPMRLEWAMLDGVVPATTRPVIEDDDARLTSTFDLVPGQLADARAKGRVAVASDKAVTIFDPDFPGAYPFRAKDGAAALAFLAALRAFAKHDFIQVVVEGQPFVRDALVEAGANVRFEIVHMSAPLS